jgi:hypothetical protein
MVDGSLLAVAAASVRGSARTESQLCGYLRLAVVVRIFRLCIFETRPHIFFFSFHLRSAQKRTSQMMLKTCNMAEIDSEQRNDAEHKIVR